MGEKKTILFIEDAEDWRETICEAFADFDIRSAENTDEFWNILKEVTPSLFLIDWLLSGGLTAESLIRQLLKDYYNIPRVVLTAGMGDEGTAGLIAELQCDYVEKGSGIDAIRDKIQQCLDRATMGRDSSDEAMAQSVKPTDSDSEKAKSDAEKERFEQGKEYYERNMAALEKRKKEIEQQKQEIDRDKEFLKRFMNTTKNIVDEDLDLAEFAREMLQLLVEYCDCCSGAIVSFKNSEGILVDRVIVKKEGAQNVKETTTYTVRPINLSEIGRLNRIKNLAQEALPKTSEALAEVRVMESFQNDKTFKRVRLGEISRRKHLLLVPLQIGGRAIGAILLFDKLNGQCFNEDDRKRIDQLPLSDMYNGAADMPFRTYKDQPGALRAVLNGICWAIAFVGIRRKPWKFRQRLMSSFMELIRFGVSVIAFLIIAVPVYIVITSISDLHSVPMKVLSTIELLIMLFTCFLFALGLIVLFEPKYAGSLPKWMLSFTRISTLERTILRLVAIILAIHVLGRFLDNETVAKYSPSELLTMSAGICLIILAVGAFSRYFLHETEENDEGT